MSGFNTQLTADTLAYTLVHAVRQGWLDHCLVRGMAQQFVMQSPLMHSGRQKFLHHFENRLAHWAGLRLSVAVMEELKRG